MRTDTWKSARAKRSATSLRERPYCPEDGDTVWIDFDPQLGREQAGRRPAIVLSSRAYSIRAELCVVCAITNHAKGYPFEVSLPSGLAVTGVVLADQVKSLSWSERNATLICSAPTKTRSDVRAKL